MPWLSHLSLTSLTPAPKKKTQLSIVISPVSTPCKATTVMHMNHGAWAVQQSSSTLHRQATFNERSEVPENRHHARLISIDASVAGRAILVRSLSGTQHLKALAWGSRLSQANFWQKLTVCVGSSFGRSYTTSSSTLYAMFLVPSGREQLDCPPGITQPLADGTSGSGNCSRSTATASALSRTRSSLGTQRPTQRSMARRPTLDEAASILHSSSTTRTHPF